MDKPALEALLARELPRPGGVIEARRTDGRVRVRAGKNTSGTEQTNLDAEREDQASAEGGEVIYKVKELA